MLDQALAATGLLVVLVMAADMLLVALRQRGWLARWAAALHSAPREDRARARRREAAHLQRKAFERPAGLSLLQPAGRHNQA